MYTFNYLISKDTWSTQWRTSYSIYKQNKNWPARLYHCPWIRTSNVDLGFFPPFVRSISTSGIVVIGEDACGWCWSVKLSFVAGGMAMVDICAVDTRWLPRWWGRVASIGFGRCIVSDGNGDWRLEKPLTTMLWLVDARSAVVVSRMLRLLLDVLGKIILIMGGVGGVRFMFFSRFVRLVAGGRIYNIICIEGSLDGWMDGFM